MWSPNLPFHMPTHLIQPSDKWPLHHPICPATCLTPSPQLPCHLSACLTPNWHARHLCRPHPNLSFNMLMHHALICSATRLAPHPKQSCPMPTCFTPICPKTHIHELLKHVPLHAYQPNFNATCYKPTTTPCLAL